MSEFIRSLPKHYLEKKLYDINTFYNLGEIFIDENGCHLWRKARNTRGYGMVKLSCNGESRTVSAYSLIFYLRKGILPDGNQDLSHLCHRPQCVNTEHLNNERLGLPLSFYLFIINSHVLDIKLFINLV